MDFSDEDKESFKLFFDLREEKNYKKAVSVLKKLDFKYKNNSVINGLLGTAFFEMERYDKSRFHFKKATILNENSELASLGLFHSLSNLGSEILALKELNRYLANNKAVKYKTTIKTLKSKTRKIDNKKYNNLVSEILLKASK